MGACVCLCPCTCAVPTVLSFIIFGLSCVLLLCLDIPIEQQLSILLMHFSDVFVGVHHLLLEGTDFSQCHSLVGSLAKFIVRDHALTHIHLNDCIFSQAETEQLLEAIAKKGLEFSILFFYLLLNY